VFGGSVYLVIVGEGVGLRVRVVWVSLLRGEESGRRWAGVEFEAEVG
jgi:hypothetical protein